MYSYAETSGFGLSWLLAIVPFNIGPKYEFVSSLVQNSPKQEPHSRSNTIFDARTILHGRIILQKSYLNGNGVPVLDKTRHKLVFRTDIEGDNGQ